MTEDTGISPVSVGAGPGTPLGFDDISLAERSTSLRSSLLEPVSPLVTGAESSRSGEPLSQVIYNCYYILPAIFICLTSETE